MFCYSFKGSFHNKAEICESEHIVSTIDKKDCDRLLYMSVRLFFIFLSASENESFTKVIKICICSRKSKYGSGWTNTVRCVIDSFILFIQTLLRH